MVKHQFNRIDNLILIVSSSWPSATIQLKETTPIIMLLNCSDGQSDLVFHRSVSDTTECNV